MSEFSISGFTGKSNIEAMKRKYPQRPPAEGETLIVFGTFKGWTVEHVNEFDHAYIVFMASIANNTYFAYHPEAKKAVDKASQLVTEEEKETRKKIIDYREEKHHQIKWLLNFISMFEKEHKDDFRALGFLRSISMQLIRQNRIELLTKKQLVVLGKIWASHYGNKRDLIKKLKPYWARKYDTLEEVLSDEKT
ncbi:MAG TPA: hypothetical protein VMV86_05635 [Methanosarcinales archaeon]|nr:hypothetical protein [Methanosarcinales archaeon]